MTSYSTDLKEIRKFGFIAFIFFGLLSILGMWMGRQFPVYFFGCLATIGIGLIVFPNRLGCVYRQWIRISHFIGKATTVLSLTIAYYLVITPAGIIKRMVSGSPLPLKPDASANTYWVARDQPAQLKQNYSKRF